MKREECQSNYVNKRKKRLYIPTGTVLMYLFITVFLTTGVSFARYSTSVSGSASAEAASFHVQMTGSSSETVTLDGSKVSGNIVEGIYSFAVTSDSEVAVEYYIEIVFQKDLPAGVTLQIDDQAVQSSDGTQNIFVFEGRQIAPNDTVEQKHELKIAGDLKILNDNFSDTVSVNVVATQID